MNRDPAFFFLMIYHGLVYKLAIHSFSTVLG